ncbi:hypothetical protein H6P81_013625 [Aristolochia fimbriata]|uniref:Uncharacterized protein n=1 Tax=Aristolochia fimbriata TaxID=158543 RepID=A0AAV7EII3_ARIFI|nr:hypothetical protein H6P81_013625 [Aristolochia fimbriata]
MENCKERVHPGVGAMVIVGSWYRHKGGGGQTLLSLAAFAYTPHTHPWRVKRGAEGAFGVLIGEEKGEGGGPTRTSRSGELR